MAWPTKKQYRGNHYISVNCFAPNFSFFRPSGLPKYAQITTPINLSKHESTKINNQEIVQEIVLTKLPTATTTTMTPSNITTTAILAKTNFHDR